MVHLAASLPAAAQVEAGEICEGNRTGSVAVDNMKTIGPMIAGTFDETAPGRGFTTGTQKSAVVIDYDDTRNRLYIQGGQGGPRVELRRVRGALKPLRWDFIKGNPLTDGILAASPEEFAYMAGCEFAVPVQLEWTMGGGRSAGGILTFINADSAIGVKWNSANGTREQVLLRN